MPLSRVRNNLTRLISNVSQIRSKVVTVIGLPASICCQCREPNR